MKLSLTVTSTIAIFTIIIFVFSFQWSIGWSHVGERVDLGVEESIKKTAFSKSTVNELASLQDHLQVLPKDLPELTFCDEYIPLHLPHVRSNYEQEIQKLTQYKYGARILLSRAYAYQKKIHRILSDYDLPEDLFYIAIIESGMQNVTSSKGASGFWQFMPSTAIAYDLEISHTIDERYHFEKSTRAACKYLKHLHKQLGNWSLVAASYNMGLSKLNRQLKAQEKNSYYHLQLNKETSRYVFKILAVKAVFSNPQLYGVSIIPRKDEMPAVEELNIQNGIDDLEGFAHSMGLDLRTLKEWNPWLISDHFVPAPDKEYVLTVPVYSYPDKSNSSVVTLVSDK